MDAITGQILEVVNLIHLCSFSEDSIETTTTTSERYSSSDSESKPVIIEKVGIKSYLYDVIKLPKNSPGDGFETVLNPAFESSSPLGWHSSTEGIEFTDTQGNNVIASIGPVSCYQRSNCTKVVGVTADGGESHVFQSGFDEKLEANETVNQRASLINGFYIANVMHDISYEFGFTEVAGNYQDNNFG